MKFCTAIALTAIFVLSFHFKFMSLGYKFRDFFLPRLSILKEVGIKP